jgi:hypothetical protein
MKAHRECGQLLINPSVSLLASGFNQPNPDSLILFWLDEP